MWMNFFPYILIRKCIVINFHSLLILATLAGFYVFVWYLTLELVQPMFFSFSSALKTMFNLLNEAVKAIERYLLPGKLPVSSLPLSNLTEILCL